MIKPTQLQKLLNISSSTLRLWCSQEYREFLSPSAQGVNGAKRVFSDKDARIIAFITKLRTQGVTHDDIVLQLRSAQAENWRSLPLLPEGLQGDIPIATVPASTAIERLTSIQNQYETQLEAVIKERDKLLAELATANARLETAQREAKADHDALQARVLELSTKEAELRGLLQQYSIGGKRRNLATMLLIALIAGLLIMALAFTITLLLTAHH